MVLVNFLGGSLDFSYNIPHIHQNLTYPEHDRLEKGVKQWRDGLLPIQKKKN
jgi:hypothetical protein